ncbi:MAG: CRTAC1 family protein [Candidatus Krumholzibacteriia bacterium]
MTLRAGLILLFLGAGAAAGADDGVSLLRAVADSGLPSTGKGYGATWADLDRDGRLDLLISLHGRGVGAWLNRGGLRFDRADTCGLLPCFAKDNHGTAACDFDADGDPELYISVGAERGMGLGFNELWDRNAEGVFRDVLAPYHPLRDSRGRGRGAVWTRLDDDAYPELVVLGFRTPPRLFHFTGTDWKEWSDAIDANRKDRREGLNVEAFLWRTVAACGDLDGDGREDLYLGGAASTVFRNTGAGGYEEIREASGLPFGPAHLAEAVLGDVDGDGDPDLVTVQADPATVTVWLNESAPGRIRFVQGQAFAPPLPPGPDSAVLADLDNDGILDLYVTGQESLEVNAPNLVAQGLGDGGFLDATALWGGRAEVPALPCGAWAVDLDQDGDLDLVALGGREDHPDREGLAVLLENTSDAGGFTLELRDRAGSCSPLGARVRLIEGGPIQSRALRSTVSHWNAAVLPLHFGTGGAAGPFRLEVRWPSGDIQQAEIPSPGRAYAWREGSEPAPVDR